MSSEIVEGANPAEAAKPKSKKMLFILGGVGAVLLLGGGGTGYMLMAGGTSEAAESEGHGAAAKGGGGHGASAPSGGGGHGSSEGSGYIDVPPMVVNLRSPDGAPRFLKLHFMLVPGPHGDEAAITAKLPAILDAYQPFLRELRPEDLAGSAAVYRIKEELLVRATEVAGEDAVSDVLIQDLIQQ